MARHKMVDWYSPKILLTVLWNIIKQKFAQSGYRERTPKAAGPDSESLFSKPQIRHLDYISDTGDGWATTHAMAKLVSRTQPLALESGELAVPELLLMGGDQVYPLAGETAYEERLRHPFAIAGKEITNQHPAAERPVFMIPGNHDWYDGLESFYKKFCNERKLGIFRTEQKRSYYALECADDWHVWGIDIELESDADAEQFHFFQAAAQKLSAESRVIFLLAQPIVSSGILVSRAHLKSTVALKQLVDKARARVALILSGDTHNYQRYQFHLEDNDYKITQIIAGGGGAFLHPTHQFYQEVPVDTVYPDANISKALTKRNFAFVEDHKPFALLLGLIYAFVFMGVGNFDALLNLPFASPLKAAVLALLCFGLWYFAEGPKKWMLGVGHSLAHVVGGWVSALLGQVVFTWVDQGLIGGSADFSPTLFNYYHLFLAGGLTVALGTLVGGSLFGLYLWLGLEKFSVHHNEAFSSLAIEDYKNFLHLFINDAGDLEISAIGVDRIADGAPGPGQNSIPPRLIETVLIKR